MVRLPSIRSAFSLLLLAIVAPRAWAQPAILKPADYAHYVEKFNTMEPETVVNLIPNDKAWDWMVANVPLFDCPDKQLEQTYYFRWWSFRKHIVQTPVGRVLTEFLVAGHGGPFNTISSAYGHHLAEGRWLRDRALLDEYTRFWFRSGPGGGLAEHFHKYSSWAEAALYNRFLATGDAQFLVDLLGDFVADYERWEKDQMRPDGLFWQYDVRDAMEESISGGRRAKNIRPTINSYMIANAQAIAKIAALAGRDDIQREFAEKAETLRDRMIAALWDPNAKFFKVQLESGKLSDAREAIDFIPWVFNIPGPEYAEAWKQLRDPGGFWAPFGLTTAERRHPAFRTHGTGRCEWDGPVWPFATSQTLTALANVLRGPEQPYVTRRDYFDALLAYSRSQQMDGKPYIGEYLDETDGHWLITGAKAERSRYYNHSTFADLVIGGLVGVMPRDDKTVEIHPLLPADAWDWFCLDGVPYHGHSLTILWDRDGNHYHRGNGLSILADGKLVGQCAGLARLTCELPATN
jgi:hypothetical protein